MSHSIRNRKSDNRSSVNREAKSLLAKLLSTENIRVVHSARVSTATWSGRTKTLTLPIWKEMSGDIYDMLVCHEVGHVLYTPDENSAEVARAVKRLTGGKKHLSESAFGFLNICEDTRIERKMKTRYPGSRRSFVRGYEWIRSTGTWQLPANANTLKFIDRVNVAAKLGAMFPVNFNTEEQVLVDRLATVNSFGDMVAVAEAMYRLAQEQKKNETKPEQPEQGDGEPEQGEGDGEAPQPGENREPQDGPASTDIPDDPDENSPKDTRSSDDDTDDGEGADSTDGDGDSDGESSDGSKSGRNKPEDKDESSDDNADGKSSDSDADGDDGDADGSDSGDADGDDTDGDADGSESGDADGDDGSESDGNGNDKSDEGGDNNANSNEGGDEANEHSDAPDAPETTTGIEDAIKNLVDRNATERVYVNVPSTILKNIIEDYKVLHKSFASGMGYGYEAATKKAIKDLAEFEKEAKPVVNTMAKRFDMKKAADEHRRAMTAKTGRINPNRLAFYKLTDDIFLRQTLLPDGKNHGLVMFIDWSGSMDNIMSKTIKQMLNLVMFCRRVGMPFEVFGFTNSDRRTDEAQAYKSGDFEIGCLRLHNWMSGRMSAREFKRALIHMMILCRHWDPGTSRGRYGRRRRSTLNVPRRFELGGTPLDDAIAVAMDIVPAFQAANNLQIVNTIFLTDGASGTSPIFSGGASHGDDIVVHDPQTRKDYRLGDFDENLGGSSYYSSTNSTALLLTMLRDRTDSNVIGFYLMSDYYGGSIGQSDLAGQMPGATPEQIAREWKRFETDKFAVSESKGYSEYYLIPADLEAKTAVLATGSAESFTAMSRSKRVNRVLLNRFIDIIAK